MEALQSLDDALTCAAAPQPWHPNLSSLAPQPTKNNHQIIVIIIIIRSHFGSSLRGIRQIHASRLRPTSMANCSRWTTAGYIA